MSYTVGEVARYAGVTVRTLHHYDAVGLLRPSARTNAGYRSYSSADLERLHRILCYRELGFALDDIATILDEPGSTALDHLKRQHDLLIEQIERLRRMVASVTTMMEARKMGISLDPDEMFEVFGDTDPTEHAEEAEQRWGDTDAYRESQRRTSSYTKEDWLRLKDEAAEIERRFAAALAQGLAPDSEEAMGSAEAHRCHIGDWFYDCHYEMHRNLGDMYVADSRFTAYYDNVAPGLAQFVRAAVHANADRAESR